MLNCCARASLDPRSVRFLFDGNILDPEGSATAESLGMEEDDEIDCMLAQVGGTLTLLN
jgi:hypothetical protein